MRIIESKEQLRGIIQAFIHCYELDTWNIMEDIDAWGFMNQAESALFYKIYFDYTSEKYSNPECRHEMIVADIDSLSDIYTRLWKVLNDIYEDCKTNKKHQS